MTHELIIDAEVPPDFPEEAKGFLSDIAARLTDGLLECHLLSTDTDHVCNLWVRPDGTVQIQWTSCVGKIHACMSAAALQDMIIRAMVAEFLKG